MSSIKHPVGPHSRRVYRRRRLAVLLVLVAIIAAVVLIIVRPGSGGDARAGVQAPAASATAAPAATPGGHATDAAARHSAAPTPTPTPTATAKKPVAGQPCTAKDVRVEALTDQDSYASDSRPLLSLSLTNTGPVSCRIDAGTDAQVYTITSGSETYWTSTDCQTDKKKQLILLAPHKTVTSAPFAWDRTRSDPKTCKDDARPEVPAGGASYHLSVSVDGITSATSTQFILR